MTNPCAWRCGLSEQIAPCEGGGAGSQRDIPMYPVLVEMVGRGGSHEAGNNGGGGVFASAWRDSVAELL